MAGVTQETSASGRRDAVIALGCVAAVVPMYLLGWAIGTALAGLLDVPEGELLTNAGPVGWVAAIGLLVVLLAPQAIGLVFGLRARRNGVRGIATVGIAANAVIGGYLFATGLIGLAFA